METAGDVVNSRGRSWGGTGNEWCGRTGRQNSRGGKMSNLNKIKSALNNFKSTSHMKCQSATVDGRCDFSPRESRNVATPLLGWVHTCNVTAYRNTVS